VLRALSDVLGKKLPYDSLTALCAQRSMPSIPHFAEIDMISTGDSSRNCRNCEESGPNEQIGVCVAGQRLLFDQPDRTRIGGDG
jgi:NADH-quinone oxidoreductase subunit G